MKRPNVRTYLFRGSTQKNKKGNHAYNLAKLKCLGRFNPGEEERLLVNY